MGKANPSKAKKGEVPNAPVVNPDGTVKPAKVPQVNPNDSGDDMPVLEKVVENANGKENAEEMEPNTSKSPDIEIKSDFVKNLIREALKDMSAEPNKQPTMSTTKSKVPPKKGSKRKSEFDPGFSMNSKRQHGDSRGAAMSGMSDIPDRRDHDMSPSESEPEYEQDYACAVDEQQIDDFLNSEEEIENEDVNSNGENDEDDWLDEMLIEFQDVEKCGPAVDENLAKMIKDFLAKRMETSKVTELFEDENKPSNISTLTTPKVNPQIWMKLKSSTKAKDVKLQKVGEKMSKSISSMVRVVDGLVKMKEKIKGGELKKEIKTLAKTSLKAVRMGTVTMQEMLQSRRTEMKFDLNATYRMLCSPPEVESELLFGANLSEKVKDLNEGRRLGSQLGRGGFLGNHRGNHNNSRWNNSRGRGRGGRGRGSYNNSRGRGHWYKNQNGKKE